MGDQKKSTQLQGRENKPTASSSRPGQHPSSPLDRFLEDVRKTDFGNPTSRDMLEKSWKTEKINLVQLIQCKAECWGQAYSKNLLEWILRTMAIRKEFETKLRARELKVDLRDRQYIMPLHLAIYNDCHGFLRCFLELCEPRSKENKDIRQLLDSSMKTDIIDNCLHIAIRERLPFVERFVAICEKDVFYALNTLGSTPLHMAMSSEDDIINMEPVIGNGISTEANSSRPRVSPQGQSPPCSRAARIVDELLKYDGTGELLGELMAKTDKEGNSPYQVRLEDVTVVPNIADDGTADAEEIFQRNLKTFVYTKIPGISNIRRALYGTRGPEKELSLDMSDFSSESHDFSLFVSELVKGVKHDHETTNGVGKSAHDEAHFDFEPCLLFVNLPDLSNFRTQCPHDGVRTLFSWLKKDKGVEEILRLYIPDSNRSPMSDALVYDAILQEFKIKMFDWRRLDINLSILTESKHASHFTELVLYSSGNWSVLHHWLSDDGLPRLPSLRKVKIQIVTLDKHNKVHDREAHDSHAKFTESYKHRLKEQHSRQREMPNTTLRAQNSPSEREPITLASLVSEQPQRPQVMANGARQLNHQYELDINNNSEWDFPAFEYKKPAVTSVQKIELFKQLSGTFDFIKKEVKRGSESEYSDILCDLIHAPAMNNIDQRIKVAIIDNGVDRVNCSFRDKISKGICFVSAIDGDTAGSSEGSLLPWWMVADPHGTEMASLINKVNPYCQLYIARVARGRKDILPRHATEAIKWALEQEVDIISISWTTKIDDAELGKIIEEASSTNQRQRATLVFCSTADEGSYSPPVYPASYDSASVVKVSATDRYGNLGPPSDGRVNIRVPGENIGAEGPFYINQQKKYNVSGSSVATALAAGIASLSLLLLKTFNWSNNVAKGKNPISRFYTRDGIMSVFNEMGGEGSTIQLAHLFPSNATADGLKNLWKESAFRMKAKSSK